MILDYNAATSAFLLRVPAEEGRRPDLLMKEQGLDFSQPASNARESVLFTREPYAAAGLTRIPGIDVRPGAMEQLAAMIKEIDLSWAKDSQAHIRTPAGEALMPFQKAGVEYAMRRQNSLIGDAPGLGKTAQSICLANEMSAKRVLVVCPANIRLQWAKQIRRWSVMKWPMTIYPILKSSHGVHPTAEWTIVSYDLLRSDPIIRALARGLYDLIILDEAHYLKTTDAKRTQAIFGGGRNQEFDPLAARAGMVVGLTGTPLPNRPRECFTLAKGLNYDSIDWMSEDTFNERFNPSARVEVINKQTGRTSYYNREETGRSAELQSRLRANFMVRRLKRDVLTQLPPITHEIVHVEETGAVKKALAAERMLDIDPEDLRGANAETLGHISVVRREMGIALAPLAVDYVDMIIRGGEDKILVFGWHIDVLDILQKGLERWGVVRVDGRTTPARKEFLKNEFIARPELRVFLGNIQSIGTGTDGLQDVCNHAVFAECSWAAGENTQATDRLDRMGQERGVLAEFLVAHNSFSEKILSSALRKLRNTHSALDGHAMEFH